jgi:hypothetical protein
MQLGGIVTMRRQIFYQRSAACLDSGRIRASVVTTAARNADLPIFSGHIDRCIEQDYGRNGGI